MTNSLSEYADVFQRLGLTELSVEDEGLKLVFKKTCNMNSISESSEFTGLKVLQPDNESKDMGFADENSVKVKAPLLGVFGELSDEKKRRVGDHVKQGDVLCSIEAMKMMNDVISPVDGIILGINAKEGDLVEYDQVLFEIKELKSEQRRN
ncbi:acetyl-CoA carboxylase biotin carboxyl carrier protein [Butyrivibrio sp. VCB2006]|uniref:acetyl-CoA carboxylase biotin carboxyl carrier protein n=1 Tax=Butyrivibrio sp. VCB2006 TaxID=1280679 RepID=UPI0003F51861|nr:acetyl-CoA carboxylase biotin carboxyl carrier protein subunit [Butyrivibrio sp. VCB2006]